MSWTALRTEIGLMFYDLSVPCFWDIAALFVARSNEERRFSTARSAKQALTAAAWKRAKLRDTPDAVRARVRDFRDARVALGWCASCLVARTTGGHVTCLACRESINAAAKKRLAAERRARGVKARGRYACGLCGSTEHNKRRCRGLRGAE